MRYAVADLKTEATQQAISQHLEKLHDSDTAQMVVFTWWRDEIKLDERTVPSHFLFDLPLPVAGATHLTIEERAL